MYSKKRYFNDFISLYSDSDKLYVQSDGFENLPDDVSNWLGRLRLLYGVPVNYLVPDEHMLPPESIRFFYLDPNWIQALLDGAYSIGREPKVEEPTRSFMLDTAALPTVLQEAGTQANEVRPKLLGIKAKHSNNTTLSGFLLRSGVVKDYPGLGVNAYPLGGTPKGENPGTLLDILRMERLGPESDTLLCLINGDAYRIDIHEAPEALHYGIDAYTVGEQGDISGQKIIYPFTKDGDTGSCIVTMNMEDPRQIHMEKYDIFRDGADSRTLNMANFAHAIQNTISSLTVIDASEMGFEMTEGVGMVSFYNKTTAK